MNISESRDPASGSTAYTAPSGALLAALTTEHFALQTARSSTVAEANGRSALFLSAVSGATVALALVAQLDQVGQTFTVFALSVLPALLALGVTSYARLADLAVHDAYYARATGRIRAFYLTIDPAARQYFMLSAGDDPHAVMRQAGQEHSRWHHLSHAATAVAAVIAVVCGVFVGLFTRTTLGLPLPGIAVGSALVAASVFAGLFLDQERRWRRSDGSEPTLFLPDGQLSHAGRGPRYSRTTDAELPDHGMTWLVGLIAVSTAAVRVVSSRRQNCRSSATAAAEIHRGGLDAKRATGSAVDELRLSSDRERPCPAVCAPGAERSARVGDRHVRCEVVSGSRATTRGRRRRPARAPGRRAACSCSWRTGSRWRR